MPKGPDTPDFVGADSEGFAERACMKQAIFFDVDGTIYDNQFHRIDPELFNEFDKLQQQGIDLFLLSSRSPFEIIHLPEQLIEYPFKGLVLEGGAAAYDQNQQLVDAWLIPGDDIKKIHDFCESHDLLWRYSGPDGNYFNRKEDPATRLHWRKLYLTVPGVKKWKGDDVCNIMIWTSHSDLKAQIAQLIPDTTVAIYPDCIEVRAKKATKANMVNALRKRLGYSHVICVGDGANDAQMIREADYGVAVGNACKEAKEAADLVINPVSEAGVTQWLKERRKKGNYHELKNRK